MSHSGTTTLILYVSLRRESCSLQFEDLPLGQDRLKDCISLLIWVMTAVKSDLLLVFIGNGVAQSVERSASHQDVPGSYPGSL